MGEGKGTYKKRKGRWKGRSFVNAERSLYTALLSTGTLVAELEAFFLTYLIDYIELISPAMFNDHSKVSIAQIVFYIPAILVSLYLCYRHKRPRLSWMILLFFSLSTHYRQ